MDDRSGIRGQGVSACACYGVLRFATWRGEGLFQVGMEDGQLHVIFVDLDHVGFAFHGDFVADFERGKLGGGIFGEVGGQIDPALAVQDVGGGELKVDGEISLGVDVLLIDYGNGHLQGDVDGGAVGVDPFLQARRLRIDAGGVHGGGGVLDREQVLGHIRQHGGDAGINLGRLGGGGLGQRQGGEQEQESGGDSFHGCPFFRIWIVDYDRPKGGDDNSHWRGIQPAEKRDSAGGTRRAVSDRQSFAQKVSNRSAKVGVIGLGYVGLPLLHAFHGAGFPVLGFDVDPAKIKALEAGENYLRHLGPTMVSDMKKAGRFEVTSEMGRLGEADAVIVCVPTPLGRHMEPDMTFIERATADIAKTLRPGQLIVLESSTYPGTTREIMLPPFEKAGLTCGRDFYLAFSPEREDQ